MPEADSNRKRSRSPSDSEQQKHHKRANTGAVPSTSDDSQPITDNADPASHSVATDVTMADAPAPVVDDNAASTPGSPGAEKIKGESSLEGKSPSGDAEGNEKSGSATTSGDPSSSTSAPAPSAMIHMRCLIVTQDASIIIGKGGSHVNEIREKSGARVMVSESIPGNPERILNVSGPLDAVSKVRPLFTGTPNVA